MRYLFRKSIPHVRRVLLVESGSRSLSERFFPVLRRVFGEGVHVDIFSCVPENDFAGQAEFGHYYRSQDVARREHRGAFLAELRKNDYQAIVIYCANSPILFRWKWWLALRLPAKVLIANENADCYWLDIGHWRNAKSMVAERSGLRGTGPIRTIGQAMLFPLVLLYLILFALAVHMRRGLRILTGGRRLSRVS